MEVFKLRNVRVNILKLQFCRQMSKAVGSLLLKSKLSESLEMRRVEEGKKTVFL